MDAELLDYLTALMPDAKTDCAKCGKSVEVSAGVRTRENIYCSETCRLQSESLLLKRQPKGLNIGGWDL